MVIIFNIYKCSVILAVERTDDGKYEREITKWRYNIEGCFTGIKEDIKNV